MIIAFLLEGSIQDIQNIFKCFGTCASLKSNEECGVRNIYTDAVAEQCLTQWLFNIKYTWDYLITEFESERI